ncbi:hypothetical protein KY310_00650 [Candidatus Woesearchaeota archaeon]|nr:hypothetical protein [Candidatus Woesearchaeota archaeon]
MRREALVTYVADDGKRVSLVLETPCVYETGFRRLVLKHNGQRTSTPLMSDNCSGAVFSLAEALTEAAQDRPDPEDFARMIDHHVEHFGVPTTAEEPVAKTRDIRDFY